MENKSMIEKEELLKYAQNKKYNLGQAEKDYFQEIILFILYQEYGQELVFKGGTALTKCYGFDRFSEDLDFSAKKEYAFEKTISNGLKRFFIEFEVEGKKHKESIDLSYRIKGPLFNGNRNSLCRIEVDISLRDVPVLKASIKKIGLQIEEIPLFQVVVMSEQEILAEKIRAILTRNKARDLYDVYYLLKKGTKVNKDLINKKIEDKHKFSITKLKKSILEKKIIYDTELKPLLKQFPSFKETQSTIIKAFQ
ncbi:MAG: nucleotidyl transferase AbiEii/AbiGii toxin family protein [Candidatus Micrarchaeota archaeon]